ncbi:aminoglycoside phosphotransferase family protein (plasmid) [Streptosporangium sp. NBC_01495]|uniref:aminoglycoside phosphotransferase family protein n=1 Tax=Streptosporangium sp. NBC_01495 TaxID=2903899 RepID=UPI002E364B6E|nr:aminoglycoside phosphotransferase family protein [Streptosporangium sp. NBC_01495]
MTDRLTTAIRHLVGAAEPIADHSWPHTSTTVLRLCKPDGRQVIVKANASIDSFHREHHALAQWTPALAELAPQLLDVDEHRQILVMTTVAGHPLSSLTLPAHQEQDAYRQAGQIMRALHTAGPRRILPSFGRDRAAYIRAQFTNGMSPLTSDEIELTHHALSLLEAMAPQQAHPAHLDFTSRNLLWDGEKTSVIDFETSRYEAAGRDFLRLTQRILHEREDLRDAFYDGYGRAPDTQESTLMHICGITDAAAIVVTATASGHKAFAAEAHHFLRKTMRS